MVSSLFDDLDTAPQQLMALIAGIDKSAWAVSDPDPLEDVLRRAVRDAPAEFWPLLNRANLFSTVSRIRNWLVKMTKAKRKDQTLPGLEFLAKLDISPDLLDHVKLESVLRSLYKSSKVRKDAESLARRYSLVLEPAEACEPPQSPSKPPRTIARPPVSRSELDIKKRQDRSPERAPRVSTQVADRVPTLTVVIPKRGREDPVESALLPKQFKKAKLRKKVHWQSDHDLLKVRYFNVDDTPQVMFEEQVMPHSPIPTRLSSLSLLPLELDNISADLRALMGIKRGGTLVPTETVFRSAKDEPPGPLEIPL